ncbi:MAG TPA: dephospho-CoA kinase [Gemmatimonadaceae bacterium]|nr:dephospho-CoA kinase [Gemmatimonadaceae bacterium]
MLTVAVTGNVASGKSEVARRFARYGATLLDSDAIAREVTAPGTPALAEIVRRWGPTVLAPDGTLDRSALRRIVFADQTELLELERIVHPRVLAEIEARLERARRAGERIVVCEVPLLFERGLQDRFDRVVLVETPEHTRLQRLANRGIGRSEALRIMALQLPPDAVRQRAHYVIANDGSLEELAERADRVWEALMHEALAKQAQLR